MAGEIMRIRKWSETFETAKTRKLCGLQWFSCPSGIDSAGYLSLMAHGADGVLAIGVFQGICQWSATCRPVIRGLLARSDGKPLSTRQLALTLRMPEEVVKKALELLSRDDVGWIEKIDIENTSVFNESATDLPVACQSSATDLPVVAVQVKESKVKESKNDSDVVIPKKLDTEQAQAAARRWFDYCLSKGFYDKVPQSGSPQEESFWRDAARQFGSSEVFCDSVDHTMANGWRTLTKPKASITSKSKQKSSEDWIEAQKASRLHPTDWQKRKELLGPERFEALKRTGSSKVADANDFELKNLQELFESHLKDVRSENGKP